MNKERLYSFLKAVDKSFPVPLSEKQDLSVLVAKFIEKATLCHVLNEGRMIALVAGYTENVTENMGYISVVATIPEARGKGYAKALVGEFIDIARSKGLSAVHLYTVRTNTSAVKMYEKLGFAEWVCENEPRPDDLHLIYRIQKENES